MNLYNFAINNNNTCLDTMRVVSCPARKKTCPEIVLSPIYLEDIVDLFDKAGNGHSEIAFQPYYTACRHGVFNLFFLFC